MSLGFFFFYVLLFLYRSGTTLRLSPLDSSTTSTMGTMGIMGMGTGLGLGLGAGTGMGSTVYRSPSGETGWLTLPLVQCALGPRPSDSSSPGLWPSL